MVLLFISVLIGIAVGILVEKGNLLDPEVIFKQFLWEDFTLLKIVLWAVATSMLVFAALNYFDIMVIESFSFGISKVILGSLLLGFGIVITGSLPITIMAQIGVGYVDAIFIFLGVILGGIFYRLLDPFLGYIEFLPRYDIATLHEALGLEYWIVASILGLMLIGIALILALIDKKSKKVEEEEIDWR